MRQCHSVGEYGLTSFGAILEWVRTHRGATDDGAIVSIDEFIDLIRQFLVAVDVDEAWYISRSPGLVTVISDGGFNSARHHYVVHGYFEGRRPFPAEDARPAPPAWTIVSRMVPVLVIGGQLQVRLTKQTLRGIAAQMVRCVVVDENWYLETYPGIKAAIANGSVTSATAHFRENGYFESCLPKDMQVDEAWYRERYPDVVQRIADGVFDSPQHHFRWQGYSQGRLPHAISGLRSGRWSVA